MLQAHFLDSSTNGAAAAAGGGFSGIIGLVLAVFFIACYWKIFTKAGKPGWAAIIPIYNLIVLLEIVGRPVWWVILLLIPCVNIVILIIVLNDLSKSFGHSVGFTIGLLLLSIVFIPILAFGSSTYRGPAAGALTTGNTGMQV